MRRVFITICSALFSLVSCNKGPATQPMQQPTKLVLNLTANQSDDTKAIKSGWEDGDILYIFFQGVPDAKYVKATYVGSSWTPELQGGLTLAELSASGKNMYAVFFPFEQPVIASDGAGGVTFKRALAEQYRGTYIYTSYSTGSASYTVDTEGDVATLSGTISMSVPDGYVQFYIDKSGSKYNSDWKYRLSIGGVKPMACISYCGGTFETRTFSAAQPMWGYKYGDGVVFSGVIEDSWASATNHKVYLFDTEAAALCGTFTGKTLSSHDAVKITTSTISSWSSLTEPGIVNYSGTNWGTFNLGASSAGIAAENYGWYFMWGDIIPATGTDAADTPNGLSFGSNATYPGTVANEVFHAKNLNLTGDYVIYDMAKAFLGPDWRLPSRFECSSLIDSYSIGENCSISAHGVVLPAAGFWVDTYAHPNLYGQYHTSTANSVSYSYHLQFDHVTSPEVASQNRSSGSSIRPVKE